MKFVLWLFALSITVAAAMSRPEDAWTVVIGGQTDGYLAPCGCVKPMSGGIKRKACAVHGLRKSTDKLLVLDNGGFSKGQGRQDEMKAEAMAEALKSLGVDAINLTSRERALGLGMLASLHRLSGEKFVASGSQPDGLPVPRWLDKGPFLVGGIDPASDPGWATAVRELVQEAKDASLAPIVMTTDGIEGARALAKAHPDLRLVVYAERSNPPVQALREGDCLLVTSGEKGKALVSVRWNGTRFEGYTVSDLGPQVGEDDEVSAIYRRYLDRVAQEKLLDMVPRTNDDAFVGSEACASCHTQEYEVWKTTGHAHAYDTLEEVHHHVDPDCVSCHVVGLQSTKGFKSRELTPLFANVGCESCHGPGRDHASSPAEHPYHKAGEDSCLSCHDPENSPTFDFPTYWDKIEH